MRLIKSNFIEILANNKITTKELSLNSGVATATIHNIKNGKSCRPDTAGKIATSLGIPVADLFEC